MLASRHGHQLRPTTELVELAAKTKAFVVDKVIPYEKDPRWTRTARPTNCGSSWTRSPRPPACSAARRHGVRRPRRSSHVGRAMVFEAAGYSMLRPARDPFAAPDEGNIHLLERRGRRRAEGALPAAAGRGRDPLVLLP